MQLLHQRTRIARSNQTFPKSTSMSCIRHTHYVNHQSQRHITHSQFLLAHHKVTKKHAAKTREAILLAFVSNPHAIRHAPMNEDPRYPAGNVIHCMPPDILVAPPSSAVDQPVEKKSHGLMKDEGNESEECGESETKDKQRIEHIGGQVP